MTPVIREGRASAHGRDAGFTLIELLVSFAVLAMALTLLVSMFGTSFELGSEIRHRRAAANFADEILTEMRLNPAAFDWPALTENLTAVVPGGEVQSSDPPAVTGVTPPAITATNRVDDQHIKDFFREFKWRGYVRLPSADAQVCELTVVVFWIDKGKSQRYTLTALAPRHIAEGKP